MHISEGVSSPSVLIAGAGLTAGSVAIGLRKLENEEIRLELCKNEKNNKFCKDKNKTKPEKVKLKWSNKKDKDNELNNNIVGVLNVTQT